MISQLVVITGPPGSGKSALARVLARKSDYKVHNIGNVLAEELDGSDLLPADRKDIGPKYLEKFGVAGYHRAVESVAGLGVVLDGVRLPSAMTALREIWPELIHLARPAAPRLENSEPYATYVSELEKMANEIVPWQASMAELPDAADRALASALEVHKRGSRRRGGDIAEPED